MQMTNCKWYGIDCSECDDVSVPSCFESAIKVCKECGSQYNSDVGCIHCEITEELEASNSVG